MQPSPPALSSCQRLLGRNTTVQLPLPPGLWVRARGCQGCRLLERQRPGSCPPGGLWAPFWSFPRTQHPPPRARWLLLTGLSKEGGENIRTHTQSMPQCSTQQGAPASAPLLGDRRPSSDPKQVPPCVLRRHPRPPDPPGAVPSSLTDLSFPLTRATPGLQALIQKTNSTRKSWWSSG